jgi:hypothetical protein
MDQESAAIHASNLVIAFNELSDDVKGYVHDPAAHNLCSAVVEGYSSLSGGKDFERHYLAYSSPKGIPKRLQDKYQTILIPPNNPHGSIFDGAGMAYLHTEVRLLNFLWANRNQRQVMPAAGQMNFFSTRSVCGGCAKYIGMAQKEFSSINIALIPFELRAEKYGGDASAAQQVYMYIARLGSGGQKRSFSSLMGDRA